MASIDGIDITSLLFQEGDAPSTPASTKWRLYFKSDGLYVIDDAGSEVGPLGAADSASELASARYVRTAGNYSINGTGSDSFADVDGTNLALTITTGARRCMVAFTGMGRSNNAGGSICIDVAIDNTRQGGTTGGLSFAHQHSTGNEWIPMSFTYITDVLTAGEHTFKLQWRQGNSAHTAELAASDPALSFAVVELLAD